MMYFEELDEVTRDWMLTEFEAEERGQPYRSTRLSEHGLGVFSSAMRHAIQSGNEEALALALADPSHWNTIETYVRHDVERQRSVNPSKAAEFLALTEFNTWYVRGFTRRLLEEGEEFCQVYRGATAWEPRNECLKHEGQVYPVRAIYDGHRARYWPPPGNPQAISIPIGTNCHHTIRRHR